MKGILTYEFIRRPVTAAIALPFVITAALLAIFLNAGMTGFYILYIMSRFSFFVIAFFTIVTFISCSSCWRHQTEEVVSAYRGPGYYQRSTAGFMVIISAVYQLMLIAFLAAAVFFNDTSAYFFSYFGKSFFCNIFLPMEICIILACLLSHINHQIISSTLLILSLIMISPLYSMLTWQTQPPFPSDSVTHFIFHPFRILYENGTYAANPLTGLQTDAARIQILIFWVLLLCAVSAFIYLRGMKFRYAAAAAFLEAGVCCLILSYLPDGAYRINENWDGTMQDFYTYYDQEPGITASDNRYEFTDYKIDISLGRTMRVNAGLHLESDNPATQFVFTLYHGYNIRTLSADQIPVEWDADGDYITLTTKSPVSELDLNMTYSGSHPIFFSCAQGCLLPGWFPWYPMAGEKQVFVNFTTAGSGYSTFNRIGTADISVNINNNFVMASNLKYSPEGTFTGRSDSITLIGGNILLPEDSQVADFLPLDLTVSPKAYISQLSQQWQSICADLENYGLKPPVSKDCTIMTAPRDLCRFYSNDSAAVFDDYILTWKNS